MKLVWFRSDLRVRDNLALAAAADGGPVAALYIATPKQWRAHEDAAIKLDFWRRNLAELARELAALGIPLVTCETADYAGVASVIKEALSAWQVDTLCFNAEYPRNESRRDQAVAVLCREMGVRVEVFHDQVLIEPGLVLNGSGEPFRVFTPFSRKCRAMLQLPAPANARKAAPAPALKPLSAQRAADTIAWPQPQAGWADLWPAGEAQAHKKLTAFCTGAIRDYKTDRDFPALDGTSTLSPWLSAGVVSVRDCWRQAMAKHRGEGPQTWQNELLWRDFYRHIVFHFPRVSQGKPFRDDYGHVPWRNDAKALQRWQQGETGIPIVDAAMRQLLETGWMHNRLRMVTAMFLAKHLLIDWREGESWFMRHLVDGDFSANNGGWQWSASTGTDAVPYFRVFNPVTQSQRFDADGRFIRRFVPALSALDNRAIHEPGLLRPAGYPAPVVDLKFGRERAIAAFKG